MEFGCTGCSLCCRNIGNWIEAAKASDNPEDPEFKHLMDFPYEWDEDGVCEQLDKESGKCNVYLDRPPLCNVRDMFVHYKSEEFPTLQSWYLVNAKACNGLIQANSYPDKFLVDETKYT